jgi:DNA-binding beta-propeller fold protein YncE
MHAKSSRPGLQSVAPLAALLALAPLTTARATAPTYTLAQTITLGSPERWENIAYDPATRTVLIAHENRIDIVNPAQPTRLAPLTGVQGPHGIAVLPDGTIYADNEYKGFVSVFPAGAHTAQTTIPAGDDEDDLVYDPARRLVAVVNGDPATVTLINVARRTVRAVITVGGRLTAAAADGQGRIYLANPGKSEISVIDAGAARVTAQLHVQSCQNAHGLAADPRARRVFLACRNQKLLVIDAGSGKTIQTLPIGAGALAFDPTHHVIATASANGVLSVFAESASGTLTPLATLAAGPGARAMGIDPATGRIFVTSANELAAAAHGHRATYAAGSLRLLVFQPG